MRTKRKSSWEAEIDRQAQLILRTRNEDAYKAAAFMVVARKLDEVKAILQTLGVGGSPEAGNGRGLRTLQQSILPAGGGTVSGVPAVQHPCSECGREGSFVIRPNRWNRKGMWLCPAHEPLKYRYGARDTDVRVRDTNGAVEEETPVVLAPEKKDTGGDVTVTDAFAALGVQ